MADNYQILMVIVLGRETYLSGAVFYNKRLIWKMVNAVRYYIISDKSFAAFKQPVTHGPRLQEISEEIFDLGSVSSKARIKSRNFLCKKVHK